MKYHTETERIANEVFDRAMQESMLPHAKFYVNGQPWRPGEEIPSSRLRIASREEQEDFWSHIPRAQMGLQERRIDWQRLRVYFALFGFSLGILIALAVGAVELVKAVRG